jgi:hypothetical protein
MPENVKDKPRGRVCLTCAHWDVRIARTTDLRDSVARCNHPDFRSAALVVSGSSNCARWTPLEGGQTRTA